MYFTSNHLIPRHDRITGQRGGKEAVTALQRADAAVKGQADVIFLGHKCPAAVFNDGPGTVTGPGQPREHLPGEGVPVVQQNGVPPVNQGQGVCPGDEERLFFLVGILLLLQLQLHVAVAGRVNPQADFLAAILLRELVVEIPVVHRIKVEGAYLVGTVLGETVRRQYLFKAGGAL